MKLTTKARYAVMAVIDMAYVHTDKPITLTDISVRQNIDLGYLEQIFNKLRKAKIVTAVKGPGGGYFLTEKDFKIVKIVEAVEENIEMTRCDNNIEKGCMPNHTKCATHHLWEGLNYQILNYLSKFTILDIVSGKLKEEVSYLKNQIIE